VKINIKEILEVQEYKKWLVLRSPKDNDKLCGELNVMVAHYNNSKSTNNRTQSVSVQSSDKLESPLSAAIKNSDLKKVTELLSKPDLDINVKDRYGYTALHSACCLFSDVDDEILSCLLKYKGIDVNAENEVHTHIHTYEY
jgi:hypothetical protein